MSQFALEDERQMRLGLQIFGHYWPSVEARAHARLTGSPRVEMSLRAKLGQPELGLVPDMTTFTGAIGVVYMHPQDYAWFVIGPEEWEYAAIVSEVAFQWLLDQRVKRAINRIENTKTPTEKREYERYLDWLDEWEEADDQREHEPYPTYEEYLKAEGYAV